MKEEVEQLLKNLNGLQVVWTDNDLTIKEAIILAGDKGISIKPLCSASEVVAKVRKTLPNFVFEIPPDNPKFCLSTHGIEAIHENIDFWNDVCNTKIVDLTKLVVVWFWQPTCFYA